ncbi:p53-induced death domain-containing protein 1 [Tachyglossus aculeatus]|uniref:p53-induced death domain-containing protein 1 n=1 Tax=Tachyglossus aculeatus TaxID=9261 RepID=UPI0018F6E8FF|nr:p53-induced death domain-containing protein 1 [Tachyglossus aculeatus]
MALSPAQTGPNRRQPVRSGGRLVYSLDGGGGARCFPSRGPTPKDSAARGGRGLNPYPAASAAAPKPRPPRPNHREGAGGHPPTLGVATTGPPLGYYWATTRPGPAPGAGDPPGEGGRRPSPHVPPPTRACRPPPPPPGPHRLSLEAPRRARAGPPGPSEHAPLGEDRRRAGAGTAGDATPIPALAVNRLHLDVAPGGCQLLLRLARERPRALLPVEFLRLDANQEPLLPALDVLPRALPALRSLVLKGGHLRDEAGAYRPGSLTSLPPALGRLVHLVHLDLSFNSLSALPACVARLGRLSSLLLAHNLLEELPEDLARLGALTYLSAMSNRLRALPPGLGALPALRSLDLAENRLRALPPEIGRLGHLAHLNLAGNRLRSLPDTLAELRSLRELIVHSNALESVPAGLARLPHMERLDLRDNRLRTLPPEIQDAPFVLLRGNPLGDPESPPPDPPGQPEAPETATRFLGSDADSFPVMPRGCQVTLGCGVRLRFPPGAAPIPIRVRYRLLPPGPRLVRLGPHDVLLSDVLELQPHGVPFHQEVQLWLPFAFPRATRGREVVVRTLSEGGGGCDLDTEVEWEGAKRLWASCRVWHFSWFLVVSRLVENRCRVPREGALLYSTVDPGVKVIFPPGVTAEPRQVCMQVLPLSARELRAVRAVTGERAAAAGPLVRLVQDHPPPQPPFLRPVRVQLPLPPGVRGLTLDRSCLHLLHGDLRGHTWDDVTGQVHLELTHLYALFEVSHFSWYWLWYTTKTYIGGIARKVYERLRLYRVNFIALQRKRDPEQVLLQCVPNHKVDPTLQKLQGRYRGPEPSDIVDMFEGEQFFAAFERGINIDSDRPDCEAGRISFVFYSHLKNMKEIYVSSERDRQSQDVKGQVSFYRGAVPAAVPEEAARQRKGPDSLWLATLPIKLPKLRLAGGEGPGPRAGPAFPPLNLGDEESGYLTQANLLTVAGRIGPDWQTVGLGLGLPFRQLERIRYNYPGSLDLQIQSMLFSWAEGQEGQPGAVARLIRALEQSERQDVADEIRAVLALGSHKYRHSLRRTGLAPEEAAAPQDPLSATG